MYITTSEVADLLKDAETRMIVGEDGAIMVLLAVVRAIVERHPADENWSILL